MESSYSKGTNKSDRLICTTMRSVPNCLAREFWRDNRFAKPVAHALPHVLKALATECLEQVVQGVRVECLNLAIDRTL